MHIFHAEERFLQSYLVPTVWKDEAIQSKILENSR